MLNKIFKYLLISFTFIDLQKAIETIPQFRVLAPRFICPENKGAHNNKPNNTIITLQTADVDINFTWTVRWEALDNPTQRLTIRLWNVVRALETRLNQPQLETNVYIIDNSQLLHGVKYTFNVTSIMSEGKGETKTFQIDNIKGDNELLNVEGRGDLISVILLGGQTTYADLETVIEAKVESCYPTQDYYFTWSLQSTDHEINVTGVVGSRLQIPPYTLKTGFIYDVNCQIIKRSTNVLITQTGHTMRVVTGGLEIYLNIDVLIVPINQEFTVKSILINHDNYNDVCVYNWWCIFENGKSLELKNSNETLTFASGLPDIGRNEIGVRVTCVDHSVSSNATIVTVKPILPVLQVDPVPRVLNEGSIITVVVNATYLSPMCTVTWYFATEQYSTNVFTINDTCIECQHGKALSESVTVYSLEESFLLELSDFDNVTQWRYSTAELSAAAGRARVVAHCGCSLTFNCSNEGFVYADLNFELNTSPRVGQIHVSPEAGTALVTMFRLSTQPAQDGDTPLRYSYYCQTGVNDSLLIESYTDHFAVETYMPYIDGGTVVWVEVCDKGGACTTSDRHTIHVSPNTDAIDFSDDVQAHVARCEMMLLRRLAISAIITLQNTGQSTSSAKFKEEIVEALQNLDENNCTSNSLQIYMDLLNWLSNCHVI